MEAFSSSQIYRELVQSLLEMQHHLFADQNNISLQVVCEDLVQPLKGWWLHDDVINEEDEEEEEDDEEEVWSHTVWSMMSFRFLVKCSITERLSAIGVKKWRMHITNMVTRISSIKFDDGALKLETYFDTIHSKLIFYEDECDRLKDAAFLLELVLWKTKVDELEASTADVRGQCRINCGAGIIIPNVLPYLTANVEENNESDEDESMDESSSGDDDSSISGSDDDDDDDDSDVVVYQPPFNFP